MSGIKKHSYAQVLFLVRYFTTTFLPLMLVVFAPIAHSSGQDFGYGHRFTHWLEYDGIASSLMRVGAGWYLLAFVALWGTGSLVYGYRKSRIFSSRFSYQLLSDHLLVIRGKRQIKIFYKDIETVDTHASLLEWMLGLDSVYIYTYSQNKNFIKSNIVTPKIALSGFSSKDATSVSFSIRKKAEEQGAIVATGLLVPEKRNNTKKYRRMIMPVISTIIFLLTFFGVIDLPSKNSNELVRAAPCYLYEELDESGTEYDVFSLTLVMRDGSATGKYHYLPAWPHAEKRKGNLAGEVVYMDRSTKEAVLDMVWDASDGHAIEKENLEIKLYEDSAEIYYHDRNSVMSQIDCFQFNEKIVVRDHIRQNINTMIEYSLSPNSAWHYRKVFVDPELRVATFTYTDAYREMEGSIKFTYHVEDQQIVVDSANDI